MPPRLKFAFFALVPFLAVALVAPTARAGFVATVAATVTPEAGGMFLYSYTVSDLATSTSPVSEFDLNLTSGMASGIITPPGALITNIMAPTGFLNTYTPGDPTISFLSSDPSTDLMAGMSGTFSFESTYGAASQAYLLRTFDASNASSPGVVLGPVPEPGSVVLMGLGLLIGLGARWRRRAS